MHKHAAALLLVFYFLFFLNNSSIGGLKGNIEKTGEPLFSIGWESPRVGALIKMVGSHPHTGLLGRHFFKYQFPSHEQVVALQPLLAITYRSYLDKNFGHYHHTGLASRGHPIISGCHIWIYEMIKSIDKPNFVNGIGIFKVKMLHTVGLVLIGKYSGQESPPPPQGGGRNKNSSPYSTTKMFNVKLLFSQIFDKKLSPPPHTYYSTKT